MLQSKPLSSAPSGRRALAISVGVAVVVSFISIALMYTSANDTREVAQNARDLHWANAALGTSALVRAANAQAVFFAVDAEIGVADRDSVSRAVLEATRPADDLEALIESPDRPEFSTESTIVDDLWALLASAREVEEQIVSGNVVSALDKNRGDLEQAFAIVSIALDDYRETVRAEIVATETAAGRLANVTQIIVTLLIPLVALFLYRSLVGRQMRHRRIEMDAKLEAERELNRAKDEFIAGLSHEFRTPLTSIYGFSEVLLETGLLDASSSLELIGLINAESSELSRMVDDLLVAARLEAAALTIKPEQIDIRGEIESTIAPWVRSDRRIEVSVPEAQVWADPLRCRQIVRNLVSNAIKHGGPNVAIHGRVEGNEFVCSVIDDGKGVNHEIAGRLFQRFVHDGREALLAGSVGLGLNIARTLALESGGDLVYERIQGNTWFTLRLPLANEAIADQRESMVSQPVAG